MAVHIIFGPTGVGKTAIATDMARRTGAPVIVLDRIQCFTDIATASGRPALAEIDGTVRIYLDNRLVSDGDLLPDEAWRRFLAILQFTCSQHELVIVEGGSMSLWKLLRDHEFGGRPVTLQIVRTDTASHEQHVLERARRMVTPQQGEASILQEVAAAWCAGQHSFLASICGIDAVLAWCRSTGIRPEDAASQALTPERCDALVARISNSHLAYAATQALLLGRGHGIGKDSSVGGSVFSR